MSFKDRHNYWKKLKHSLSPLKSRLSLGNIDINTPSVKYQIPCPTPSKIDLKDY